MTLALAASACGDDDDPGVVSVSGEVENLGDDPVVLGLSLDGELAADETVEESGPFVIEAERGDADSFEVEVTEQPEDRHCEVENGSGQIGEDAPGEVAVECAEAAETISIGGEVSGLGDDPVELTALLDGDAAGSESVSSDGPFAIEVEPAGAESYEVEISEQPGDRACFLENADGDLEGEDIDDVVVACDPADFGTLSAYNDGAVMRLSWGREEAVDLLYASEQACDWDDYESCEGGGRIADLEGGEVALGAGAGGDSEGEFDADEPWFFALERGGERSNTVSARPTPPSVMFGAGRLEVDDERLYLSAPASVGPQTGAAALFSISEGGTFGTVPAFTSGGDPAEIRDAVKDGEGGWVIAGDFDEVGGEARSYLARLRPDGSVDRDWQGAVDAEVTALAYADGRVYVGGEFDEAGGAARANLAAFEDGSGELETGWQPDADDIDTVDVVEATGERVFVGGELSVDDRENVAALDPDDGSVDGDFDPDPDGAIFDLERSEDHLYLAGSFDAIGPAGDLDNLARVNAETGEFDTDWGGGVDGPAQALSAEGDRVYVGGSFEDNLAAFDAEEGEADEDWSPATDNEVLALKATDDRVYVGGWFTEVNDQFHPTGAALDPANGAILGDRQVSSADFTALSAISVSGDELLLGSLGSAAVGHQPQDQVAAIELQTGAPVPNWGPIEIGAAGGGCDRVEDISLLGEELWVGGCYGEVSGELAGNIASLDAETGDVEHTPIGIPTGSTQDVRAVETEDDRIYAGGHFSVAENENLESWNADGTRADAWDTGDAIESFVEEVARIGDTLYIAGSFDTIHGEDRDLFAALDANTGDLVADWDPGASLTSTPASSAFSFAAADSGGRVFLGGTFEDFDGDDDLAGLVAFDAQSGDPIDGFAPSFEGDVFDVAYADGVVYAAGDFTEVDGEPRGGVAAFDASDGSLLESWAPGGVDEEALAVAVAGGVVYVTGVFERAGGPGEARDARRRDNLVAFDEETGELIW